MKIVSSSRRQIVMAVLLGFATLGAVIRFNAPNPSTLRDIGTLMLVLWLPAVGNLVAFVVRTLVPRLRPATRFSDAAAFVPQIRAEISAIENVRIRDQAQRDFTVVVGNEGFRARTAAPLAAALAEAGSCTVDFEFLRPQLALAKLPPATQFTLLAGHDAVAKGRVA